MTMAGFLSIRFLSIKFSSVRFLPILLLTLLLEPAFARTGGKSLDIGSRSDQRLRALFESGQTLNFDVSLAGQFVAGELSLATADRVRIGGIDAYHVKAQLRSVGLVNALHRQIDESYDSYIDPATLRPIRVVESSGNGRTETTTIEQDKELATAASGQRIKLPPDTYDPASLLCVIRTVDPAPGHKRIFHMLRGSNLYTVSVEPEGKEKIYTRVADYEAYRFAVKIVGETNESDEYKIRLYLTKDDHRLPVLITAQVPGGNGNAQVRVELTRHTG